MKIFTRLILLISVTYADISTPMIITTWGSPGFFKATEKAYAATKLGGRMYGLVEGLSKCEELQCDTTVGFGGSPDESGETTLDAMIIDSEGMKIGSVANLHRIRNAAKVAWAVMNYTQHTLLVGESATNFAKSVGFKEEDLSTDLTKKWMEEWKNSSCQPNYWKNVLPDALHSCGPYKPNQISDFPRDIVQKIRPEINTFNHDTIGMVIVDENNITAAGTSSNGARFKIPGRVGDSPIPGAGAYASQFGGAAATGDGDVMMRFLPSFHVVQMMEYGTKPSKAIHRTFKRMLKYYPNFQGAIVALNTAGKVGAACANIKNFAYNVAYKNGTVVTNKIPCIQKHQLHQSSKIMKHRKHRDF